MHKHNLFFEYRSQPSALLIVLGSIEAGEDGLVRHDEFQALSQAQKALIVNVLTRLQLMSSDIKTSITASEVATRPRLGKLPVDLPNTIKHSETKGMAQLPAQATASNRRETKAMTPFDAQNLILQERAQQQNVQTNILQYQSQDPLRTRLLDALAFPEMDERRSMIERRVAEFGRTSRWIFDSSEDTDTSEDSEDIEIGKGWVHVHGFVEWLKYGQQLFWICGKPGSGKSTLMDYVFQNLQPGQAGHDYLKEWAHPDPVRLLNFWFFRPASSMMLKSIEGLWRSLCFQILDAEENLVGKVRSNEDGSAPRTLVACLTEARFQPGTWTAAELQLWFMYLVTNSESKYCLLVDGLDELANHRETLLNCIQEVVSRSDSLKVCCSSRSEHPFLDVLGYYPSLNLQDFNCNDIKTHCRKRLADTSAMHLADKIVDRADGVFLWADMVAEDLKTASSEGDTEEDLRLRLRQCPDEMHGLFECMLKRRDKFYSKHPKPYLHLINTATGCGEPITVLELLLASHEHERLRSSFPDQLDAHLASLDALAADLEVDIVARCAGLIEWVEPDSEPRRSICLSETSHHRALVKAHKRELRFIHLSAQDFVLETELGIGLRQTCGISDQDAFKRLLLARATIFLINTHDLDEESVLSWVDRIDKESWTPCETTIVDVVFETFLSRGPDRMSLKRPKVEDSNSLIIFRFSRIEALCPTLAPVDNTKFSVATSRSMLAYIEAKLPVIDTERASLLAGFCLVCLILTDWDQPLELVSILVSHLSWTQDIELCYGAGETGHFSFSVNRPLWQHAQLALTHRYHAPELQCSEERERERKRVQSICNLFHDFPRGNGVANNVEGCIIGIWNQGWVICPVADEVLAPHRQYLSKIHVFKIHTSLNEPGRQEAISLSFQGWSPAGVVHFFEIDAKANQALQKLFFNQDLGAHDESGGEHLATILNDHLAELSPAEIAEIVSLHGHEPRLIFSKGKFRGVDGNDRNAWENRLGTGLYYDDFETDPEHGPILKTLIDTSQPEWVEKLRRQRKIEVWLWRAMNGELGDLCSDKSQGNAKGGVESAKAA